MSPPAFAARFDFATRRHGPVKKRVESRDPYPTGRRLDVFEKSGKPADDPARVPLLGLVIKLIERDPSFFRAGRPGRRLNFFWSKFALEREQDLPFMLAEIDNLHGSHFCGRF